MPTAFVCATCGVQHTPSDEPPTSCAICEDERQYVPATGQRWTTIEDLRRQGHRNSFEELEPGLVSIVTEPSFAIGQHALLVRTPEANILWDCITLIDDATVNAIAAVGGIDAIAISHPHFYDACVEWARAFGATIHLPAADRRWVMRPDPSISFFDDDEVELADGVVVVRVGGHFEGSTVLWWRDGAEGRGALLTGDSIATVEDRSSVTVMYSFPNRIPLSPSEVREVAARALRRPFDRLYAGWRGDVVASDAPDAIRSSIERYARMVEGTWPRA